MQVGIEQCSVVVPTVGRPSLDVLLDALARVSAAARTRR